MKRSTPADWAADYPSPHPRDARRNHRSLTENVRGPARKAFREALQAWDWLGIELTREEMLEVSAVCGLYDPKSRMEIWQAKGKGRGIGRPPRAEADSRREDRARAADTRKLLARRGRGGGTQGPT